MTDPAQAPARIDLGCVLDGRRLGWLDVRLTALLIGVMAIDGYDVFVVGSILPFLAHDLHVAPPALTAVFVAQQFGLLIGTLFLGPLSDRFGRRASLLSCVAIFSALTLLTTQITTATQLLKLRFASSLFFAGIIPNSVALSSETTPRRMQAGLVSVVMCGFTAGHFIEAFVQAYLLESVGWRSAFWVGGWLGVLMFFLLLAFLPESPRFLARRNPADPKLRARLLRIDPSLPSDATFTVIDSSSAATRGDSSSAKTLFGRTLLVPTLLVWTVFLCTFLVNHLVGSWNTTVLRTLANVSMQRIAAGAAIGTTVGMAGTCASGFLMDRFGATRMIALFLGGSALSVMAFGAIDLQGAAFFVVTALLAFFINSVLGGINALSAIMYPSGVRGTGVAWAAGAGRAGGMLGPAFGGFMLAQGWSVTMLYVATGAPLLLAMVALLLGGTQRFAASARPVSVAHNEG